MITRSAKLSQIKLVYIWVLLILVTLCFQNCDLNKLHDSTASSYRPGKLLFKSNFGTGVNVEALSGYNSTGTGAWRYLSGTDQETGFSWDDIGVGENYAAIQYITFEPVTPTNIGDYIESGIRPVIGPHGNLVNELYQYVKKKSPVGEGGSQAPLVINRPWDKGDVNDFYISYWYKHQADLVTQLDSTVSSGNWRAQFGFKTGGYLNSWEGDYRIGTGILKGTDNKLYWYTKGDNVANGPWERVDYWKVENHEVPVPIDTWFKYEAYWHRSGGGDGRYWSAVNGQIIVDYHGPIMGDYNLPINRIFIVNPYSGGSPVVESHMTELEIWDGFPCGDGQPCY